LKASKAAHLATSEFSILSPHFSVLSSQFAVHWQRI